MKGRNARKNVARTEEWKENRRFIISVPVRAHNRILIPAGLVSLRELENVALSLSSVLASGLMVWSPNLSLSPIPKLDTQTGLADQKTQSCSLLRAELFIAEQPGGCPALPVSGATADETGMVAEASADHQAKQRCCFAT
ncbi:hypothetical protein [Alkalilacustris brevis]|uniref:hypothetical protein n=1 Tax=Alkalilacustris brevis TaxID=2026338 RepID=UPI0012D30A07|nr:hypothetical protein [Alkalilacustris brevis]